MNITEHKGLSKWRACRDWHRSEYRTAAERRDAAIKRREARIGLVFAVICAGVVMWTWL